MTDEKKVYGGEDLRKLLRANSQFKTVWIGGVRYEMPEGFDERKLARDEREGITDDEILAVLNAVDRGELSVTKLKYEHYRLGNGWLVEIFWDVGEFDYVREITLPDGRCINMFDGDPERVPVQNWDPEHPERWEE